MAFRLAVIVLGILLATEAVVLLWAHSRTAQERRPSAGMQVSHALRVRHHPMTASDKQHLGQIDFTLPSGWSGQGLCTAMLFPERDGMPATEEPMDATLLQDEAGRLHLRRWVEEANPQGPYLLRFSIRSRRAAANRPAQGYFVGWTRFQVADLRTGSVRVAVQSRATRCLLVSLSSGQPVPGALVALGGPLARQDAATVALRTDGTGIIRVMGLDEDEAGTWLLHNGPGPSKTKLTQRWGPEHTYVELTVPLAGAWSFGHVPLMRQAPGQALRIEGVRFPADRHARAWPVADFLLAGGQNQDPLVLMWRGSVPDDAVTSIGVQRHRPVTGRFADLLERGARIEPATDPEGR